MIKVVYCLLCYSELKWLVHTYSSLTVFIALLRYALAYKTDRSVLGSTYWNPNKTTQLTLFLQDLHNIWCLLLTDKIRVNIKLTLLFIANILLLWNSIEYFPYTRKKLISFIPQASLDYRLVDSYARIRICKPTSEEHITTIID